MILNYGLKFNRFGEEIDTEIPTGDYITADKLDAALQNKFQTPNDYVKLDELDAKLLSLQNNFKAGAKQMFTNIEDHVKKTEELVKAVTVDKNYISLNNKRIVSVARALNKNDVVVKSQLENVIKTSTDLINKRITEHVEKFDKFKVDYDTHLNKYRDHLSEYSRLKTHISEEFQEILEKQKQHNDKIIALESKP